MFLYKNIVVSKKIKKNIRGKNKEAILFQLSFFLTITISIISILSTQVNEFFIPIIFLSNNYFQYVGIILLILNLIISFLALIHMRDSWRIGIIEGEKTELVTDGIFSISRNPYFLSGIIQFIAYIFLIKNLVVIIFCLLSILLIHKMVIKEETFLESLHGDKYLKYKKEVARYFII